MCHKCEDRMSYSGSCECKDPSQQVSSSSRTPVFLYVFLPTKDPEGSRKLSSNPPLDLLGALGSSTVMIAGTQEKLSGCEMVP